MEAYKRNAAKCGHYGLMVGLVTGPFFTWLRLRANDVTADSVWDRCYRLRHNRGQVLAHSFCLVKLLQNRNFLTFCGTGL